METRHLRNRGSRTARAAQGAVRCSPCTPCCTAPTQQRTRLVLQHKQLPHARHQTWALKKDEPAEERELLWDRLLWQLRQPAGDLRDGGFFGGGAGPAGGLHGLAMDRATAATDAALLLPPRLPDSLGHLSAWSEAIVRDGAGASDSTARLGAPGICG
uniref:Uncharacterized protein n=1 Tax=Macrostomum lignano TaxID=282301 RepID=A0A1I8FAY2_9PLAT